MTEQQREILGGIFLGVVALTTPIWLRVLIAWDLGVTP